MKIILTLILSCCLYLSSYAQEPIRYYLNLDNIQHHELDITVEFEALPRQALHVRMPTASPGRYAEHNFAKNVYDVKAYNAAGASLSVYKIDIDEWQVEGHDGYVRFEYTLFGNHGDGTYSGIDNRKLHLNMPATFVYGRGLEERPVLLSIDLTAYKDWKVATQLEMLADGSLRAPDYAYFFDSPTMVGAIDFRRWTSTSNGKDYTIEVAMMHEGIDEELDKYAEWIKKIVEEQKEIYGSLPDFDFGRYTFLCMYNPWVFGDGMEHRNSTICSSTGNLENNASRLIGTVSHEFFHCWNVERIRPKSLEPFNLDEANMSDALWFAEGFTSYYTRLTLVRAGIISPEDYISGLIGTINYVTNSPGRQYRNPIEMSQCAPFVDAASSIDEVNFSNTFISYYSYGSYLGLALDLELRSRFYNVSLDDLMAYLWVHFGKTEIPYEVRDLEQALGVVSGDPDFAKAFFKKYIYESQLPDLQDLLRKFGVQLELANPGQSDLNNLSVSYTDEGAKVETSVNEFHSLYTAGMNKGDVIKTINGKTVDETSGLPAFEIGEVYEITYLQNGMIMSSRMMAEEDKSLKIELKSEVKGKELERQKSWLE